MAKRDAELNKKIGDRLTMARKSSRDENGEPYTQSKILDKISEAGGHSSYDPASASGWEHGKHMPPTIAYKVYSDISGWSVDYLMGLSDDPMQTRSEYLQSAIDRFKDNDAKRKENDMVAIINALNSLPIGPYFSKKTESEYYFRFGKDEPVIIDKETCNIIVKGLHSSIQNYLANSYYLLCKKTKKSQ